MSGYTISRPRRARGVRKKGYLVGQGALRHDSVAPEQLPADVIAHPKLVVTRKSGGAILKQARTGKSTKALRELLRDVRGSDQRLPGRKTQRPARTSMKRRRPASR